MGKDNKDCGCEPEARPELRRMVSAEEATRAYANTPRPSNGPRRYAETGTNAAPNRPVQPFADGLIHLPAHMTSRAVMEPGKRGMQPNAAVDGPLAAAMYNTLANAKRETLAPPLAMDGVAMIGGAEVRLVSPLRLSALPNVKPTGLFDRSGSSVTDIQEDHAPDDWKSEGYDSIELGYSARKTSKDAKANGTCAWETTNQTPAWLTLEAVYEPYLEQGNSYDTDFQAAFEGRQLERILVEYANVDGVGPLISLNDLISSLTEYLRRRTSPLCEAPCTLSVSLHRYQLKKKSVASHVAVEMSDVVGKFSYSVWISITLEFDVWVTYQCDKTGEKRASF